MDILKNTKPFWNPIKGGSLKIHNYKLRMFLSLCGFGQFASADSRTSSKSIFHNDEGILKIHDETSIKRWVREWLESVDESEFGRGGLLDTSTSQFESCDKWDVLEQWQKLNQTSFKNLVLDDLPIHSEEGFADTETINLYSDTKDSCHIRFKNGVVKITKDNIQFLESSKVRTKGAVWESSIINRNITLDDESKGLFVEFATKAMFYNETETYTNKDWRKDFQPTTYSDHQMRGMRTAYGYLIHSHNTPDVSKACLWIDAGSDIGRPEGGNGKSVVMESVQHFKKTVKQEGKKWRNAMADGGRFQFSNVTPDTKFLMIDDIRPEFSFEDMFSMITGDMEVEGKKTNKFVIPSHRKPKFGLTTNYVLPGVGTSFKRRQHIVEFGNYWNKANRENEAPSDKKHLGRMLFGDSFTEQDWNDFYNFGFNCVREYLRDGLVESPIMNYRHKALKATVEGAEGDGTFSGWLDDWIRNDRLENDYHLDDGISLDELYNSFIRENPLQHPDAKGIWDLRRFDAGVWDYVDASEGYYYNKHLSKRGTTKSSRRWQRGPAGQQKNHIKVTTDFDMEWKSLK